MPLFGRPKETIWCSDTLSAAGHRRPIERGGINTDFPWKDVQQLTDALLKKKKDTSLQARDARCLALIQKHEVPAIALAGCAHAMTGATIRQWIQNQYESYDDKERTNYLHSILIANHANPHAVGRPDVRIAHTLLTYSAIPERACQERLRLVVDLLIEGGIDVSLAFAYQHFIKLVRKEIIQFANRLNTARERGEWFQAQELAQWLQQIEALNGGVGWQEATSLLQDSIGDIGPWLMWNPDIARLEVRKHLTIQQREELKDFLALEGPDFERTRTSLLKEGIIVRSIYNPTFVVRHGTICLRIPVGRIHGQYVRDILQRLSRAIDAACSGSAADVDLLIHLCVDKPVDNDILHILAAVRNERNSLFAADVLELFRPTNGRMHTDAISNIGRYMSVVTGINVRKALGRYYVSSVVSRFEELQRQFSARLEQRQALNDADSELHAFGETVQGMAWLMPLLPEGLLEQLSNWPTSKEMNDLGILWNAARESSEAAAPALLNKLRVYYTDIMIRPQRNNVTPMKVLVDALSELWSNLDADLSSIGAVVGSYDRFDDIPNGNDIEPKRALALYVAQDPGKKNTGLRCRCLTQIPILPDKFIRGLLQVIRIVPTQADKACMDLIDLFTNCADDMSHEVRSSWRPVLLSMLQAQDETLIDYALGKKNAREWFEWLFDVQMIFVDLLMRDPSTFPTILRSEIHEWSQKIYYNLRVIELLEQHSGDQTAVHCILTGFRCVDPEIIVEIIGRLMDECEHCEPMRAMPRAMLATLERLERDGGNAKEVLQALETLPGATELGAVTYMRIIETYQLASPQVAIVFLHMWTERLDLQDGDSLALDHLKRLLGLDLVDVSSLPQSAFDAAAEYMSDQASRLLAEAERMDALRRALKSADPQGTSTFLAELGIEDTSPIDDELAALPTELINVIDKVDEDQVELQFPLTHFTAFQRTAMGAGNSRSLVVRLVLGYFREPPGFCMHLDGEDKATIKDRNSTHQTAVVATKTTTKDNNFGDREIVAELRNIISKTAAKDLPNLTLKELKTDLEKRLGMNLDSKREFINQTVDDIMMGIIPMIPSPTESESSDEDPFKGLVTTQSSEQSGASSDNASWQLPGGFDFSYILKSLRPSNASPQIPGALPEEPPTKHVPWFFYANGGIVTSEGKNASPCQKRTTRLTYQLGHILSQYILSKGEITIAETYTTLRTAINNLRLNCIVCGSSLGVKLHRSTVCAKPPCRATWLKASLNVQMGDFHHDPQVADLLLSAVQAAAHTSNTALLPGCTESSLSEVTRLLGSIPSLKKLQSSADLNPVFSSLGKRTEALVSWALSHHSGYLLSATGPLKIPSFPGAHQFILANAAPDMEKFFAQQLAGQPTHVMFHGTSLDRLFAILCQGLRVCSGTALQRHGAFAGNGIYVTDNPATAWGYATPSVSKGGGWQSSTFSNVRVLLGIEAAASVPSTALQVVANPAQLLLRYVFVLPVGVNAPLVQHIEPSMKSAFDSLRRGVM